MNERISYPSIEPSWIPVAQEDGFD
uniref:Uncharacterized protein n=1 Tax=Anguilla anguilla TaxID=7936 RepID=A0A0E9VR11_ANGAN